MMQPTLSDSMVDAYFRQVAACMTHPIALDALAAEIELDSRLATEDREYLMRILNEVTVGSHPGSDSEEPIDPPITVDDDDVATDDDTDTLPSDWQPSPDPDDFEEPFPTHDPGEAGAVYRDRVCINLPCKPCNGVGCISCEFTGTITRF